MRRLSQDGQRPVFDKKDDKEPKPFGKDKGRFGAVRPGVPAHPATGVRAGPCAPPAKGTRRVQLVRRDGRDVSTLYGREGGGGGGGGSAC